MYICHTIYNSEIRCFSIQIILLSHGDPFFKIQKHYQGYHLYYLLFPAHFLSIYQVFVCNQL